MLNQDVRMQLRMIILPRLLPRVLAHLYSLLDLALQPVVYGRGLHTTSEWGKGRALLWRRDGGEVRCLQLVCWSLNWVRTGLPFLLQLRTYLLHLVAQHRLWQRLRIRHPDTTSRIHHSRFSSRVWQVATLCSIVACRNCALLTTSHPLLHEFVRQKYAWLISSLLIGVSSLHAWFGVSRLGSHYVLVLERNEGRTSTSGPTGAHSRINPQWQSCLIVHLLNLSKYRARTLCFHTFISYSN